ncbi:MAG: SufE family protein [Bacteriovoracaceae bacterium]|nr:SufE family protein [Bacteriovoracaceae bacterium]
MLIEEKIDKLIAEFDGMDDWELRYKHVINIGKNLQKMPIEFKVDHNKVKGCQSQAWLHAKMEGDRIKFFGDSDALIVKGIMGMILQVYSGSTLNEVLRTKPTFLDKIGIREHLSMSRANGLSLMLKQISLYALAFQTKLNMLKIVKDNESQIS